MKCLMKYLMIAITALVLSACSTVDGLTKSGSAARVAVQYSTMKLISQSSDVTSEDVLQRVEAVRALASADDTATVTALAEGVAEAVGWDSLDPADQMLVRQLLIEAERQLQQKVGEGVLQEDDWVTVRALLDWIAQAARMAAQ